MPATARTHFNDDLGRAQAILDEADRVPASRSAVADDMRRAGVALAVAALDAYLCDAYIDCLTRCLRALREGKCSKLPAEYAKELLPAGPLLAQHYTKRSNWGLRMAARSRMERENMLQVGRVKEIFNPVLPNNHKLWIDVIDQYTSLGRKRLTKHRAVDIAAMTPANRTEARRQAAAALVKRVLVIVQRRHDIVHNFDRPKSAPQALTAGQAKSMVRDVKDFVTILDNHLDQHRSW
jgi:RiboL-PSP-HEPN